MIPVCDRDDVHPGLMIALSARARHAQRAALDLVRADSAVARARNFNNDGLRMLLAASGTRTCRTTSPR
jgi:hypothetical protein